MRRMLWLLVAIAVVVPSTSTAAVELAGTVDASAAGPGTGLRYAERFRALDGWQQTMRIVTVDEPQTVLDAQAETQDAVPVTVQRRTTDGTVAAERCLAHPDEPRALQRQPLTDDELASPLQRAWQAVGGQPADAFDPIPNPSQGGLPDATFEATPCPARGPAATLDLQDTADVPWTALLPPDLPLPEATDAEGSVDAEEARFHDRPARWLNATFTLTLPGPLPGPEGGLVEEPLHVSGRTATLVAAEVPGPVQREVSLELSSPDTPGYDRELAWQIELTGYEAGDQTKLEEAATPASTPDETEPWTNRGPKTTAYPVAFPLEEAFEHLEQTAPGYKAYRFENPEASLVAASYDAHASPIPAKTPTADAIEGPAWTIHLASPEEPYRGAVLRSAEASQPGGFQSTNESSASYHVWEDPLQVRDETSPGATSVTPVPDRLAHGQLVLDRLDRAGVPVEGLDRLGFQVEARQAGAGGQVTLDVAATWKAPPSTPDPEGMQAVVDGATGRLVALSGPVPTDDPSLFGVVPATLASDDETGTEGLSASLPSGPAAGVGLTAGAALLWLILLGLKPILTPLFTRLSREELLDNPTRKRLVETIREQPGAHLAALIEETGVGNGATRHHLRKLEEAHLIRRVEHGGYVRFFPAGEFTEQEARQRAVLRSGSNRTVYDLYEENPQQSIRELARRLDKSPSSVHRSIEMLREVGLVDG